jgi:chromosome segregation ATPase
MTEFLSKLLSPLNLQKRKNGPSLMQGARFNTMQNIIIKPTYNNLDLMSQTTGDGLGSITESMKNMDVDFTKSLDDLDKKEVSKLAKEEGIYNSLINKMKLKQSQMNKLIIGQKGKATINKLKSEIENLDKQIMEKAEQITQNAYKANNVNNNVEKDMEVESQKLHKQMMMLKSRKQQLNSLLQKQNDLDGRIADGRNELDSSYINYMVWFLCATTLGIIAVRQLSK